MVRARHRLEDNPSFKEEGMSWACLLLGLGPCLVLTGWADDHSRDSCATKESAPAARRVSKNIYQDLVASVEMPTLANLIPTSALTLPNPLLAVAIVYPNRCMYP